MYITKIISFENSLALLDERVEILNDIKGFVESITIERIRNSELRYSHGADDELSESKFHGCWSDTLKESDWVSSRKYLWDDVENRKYYGFLGDCYEDVSIRLITHRDLMNRWLFSTTPIAYKNSVINIPVAVMLTSDAQKTVSGERRSRSIMGTNFEKAVEELQALSPLSHTHPFVIIGVSFEAEDLEVIELDSELGLADKQIVINRSIEFPSEYHSAGLGILSYFGTVIREKYPNEEAKVKIEQDGQKVRMIIETKDGNKEIIEKALHEYELVITGERPPESLYDDALKVLELKTELRLAHARIESQKDLLEHKGQEISSLRSLFESSLSQGQGKLQSLTVSPIINVTTNQTNSTVINNDLLDIADEIKSLVSMSGDDSGIELRLLDMNESVDNISPTATPEEVKSSVGFSKLKKFIEDSAVVGSNANKFFENLNGGIERLKSLGSKYNSVAEWCGAPQIPSVFVKEKN